MTKLIAANAGLERGVLAGLAKHGKTAYYDVVDIIGVNSFLIENNQAIYKSIEKALEANDTIDPTSVLAAAESLGLDSILTKNKADIEYIRALFNFPIQLSSVRTLAKQLAKLEFIKKAQLAHLDTCDKLSVLDGTEPIDEIVGISESSIFELTQEINHGADNNPTLLLANAKERLNFLEKNPVEMVGIPTPWPIYNDLIGGGLRSGVHLVCSRQKVGKSTFAINVAIHVAQTLRIPVLYIDTEMTLEEQENRIIANISQVDNKLIETGRFASNLKYKEAIYKAIEKHSNIPFHHKWVGGRSFEEIAAIMRRWIMSTVGFDKNGRTNPHLVIYDYFKLMDDSMLEKMKEYQAIGFQISYLSDFCKKYDTPCLSFAQLNREGIKSDAGDTIGDSDRLLRLCVSCCLFKRKDADEISEDGKRWGNRKLLLLEGRFGEPLEYGDYVCMNLDGKTSLITEYKTKFQIVQEQDKQDTGFEISTEKQNDVVDGDIQ